MTDTTTTTRDPAIGAIAEYRRMLRAFPAESILPGEPDPTQSYWSANVATTKPTTLAGAIALLEEAVKDDALELVPNVIAWLRQLERPAPIDTVRKADGAPLLLFDPKYSWSIGYWSDDSGAWWAEDCATRLRPTYWAPMPADPRP